MTPGELADRHPVLYHVTSPGAWELIAKHGLLSTAALLRKMDWAEPDVDRYVAQRRPARKPLDDARFGRVILNDNSPLSELALTKCLDDGLTPADWLRMLNDRVFFWVDASDMEKLRDAAANKADKQQVLKFDTRRLVQDNVERVQLAPFNTGSTQRRATRRGRCTFAPLLSTSHNDFAERRQRAGIIKGKDRIKEVVVLDHVPNAEAYFLGFHE